MSRQIEEALRTYDEVSRQVFRNGLSESVLREMWYELLFRKSAILDAFGLNEENNYRRAIPIDGDPSPLDFLLEDEYPATFFLLKDLFGHEVTIQSDGTVLGLPSGPRKIGRLFLKSLNRNTFSDDLIQQARRSLTELGSWSPVMADKEVPETLKREFSPKLGELFLTGGREFSVLLSAHIADFIGCATGLPFTSCYSIGGEHFAGVSSHIVDAHTLLAYFVRDGQRIGRVLLHIPENGLAVIRARIYGMFPLKARWVLYHELASVVFGEPSWVSVDGVFNLRLDCGMFLGFLDAAHASTKCRTLYMPEYEAFPIHLSFPDSRCLGCGSWEPGAMGSCMDCAVEDMVLCDVCQRPTPRSKSLEAEDGEVMVCPWCFDMDFAECDECSKHFYLENLTENEASGQVLCPKCYKEAVA